MPRVLIAGFTALPGPHRVGVQLRHVMRALIRHHKVDVLVLRRGEQAYVERSGSARILRVPVPDGDIVGRVEAFRRALRRQLEGADYDIVHFSDGWAGKTVLELQPQLKYATVYDGGRSPLTGPLPLDVSVVSELQRTEALCASSADLVLAPTEPARQFLAGGGEDKRVHLVAPGVDVDLFDWDLPPTDGPPLILYIGTLSQGRGIQLLLGAMIDLIRDGSKANLVLAGRAGREFRTNLAATLRDLDLESRVQFTGVLDHGRVPELISRATVCVAPGAPDLSNNRLALYPTKILEYLACQRAVVAPKRSSVSLLLRDGQTGLLFEPGQPSDLAATLKRALGDHALRARVARAGYDLVRRAHSASSTRRELTAAYSWLASISPWRERFSQSDSELSDADVRLPGPEDTEAAAWVRNGAAKQSSFESSDVDISESTGSGSLETAIGDSVGEVTRVEVSPLLDDSVTRSTSLYPIDQNKADGWVVEDANTRPSSRSGVVGEELPTRAPDSGILSSMDSSFVAGELNVGDDTDEVELEGGELTAAGELLGVVASEEKTRLFAVPPELRKPTSPSPRQESEREKRAGREKRATEPAPRKGRRPSRSSDATQIADHRPVQAGRPPAARASHPNKPTGAPTSTPTSTPTSAPTSAPTRRQSSRTTPAPPRAGRGAPGQRPELPHSVAPPTPVPIDRTKPPPVPGGPVVRDENLSPSTQPFPRVTTPPDGSQT